MAEPNQPDGDDLEPVVPAPRAGEPDYYEPRGEQLAIEGGREDGPPVDPPSVSTTFADITSRYQGDRKPIVPASLRSKAGRHALMVEVVSFVTYSAAIHITRSPKYAAKTAWYAPYGLARLTGKGIHWCLDLEGFGIRQDAASRNNVQDYLALSRQRDRRVGARAWLAVPVVLLLVVLVGLLAFVAPWWAQALAAAIVVPFLAHVGRPIDAPILDRVFNAERFIRLTAGLTRAAILACSVKGIKGAKDIKFVRDISREGPGHEALLWALTRRPFHADFNSRLRRSRRRPHARRRACAGGHPESEPHRRRRGPQAGRSRRDRLGHRQGRRRQGLL